MHSIAAMSTSLRKDANLAAWLFGVQVGPTGTGKSVYVKSFLSERLDRAKWTHMVFNFSAQTSANMTQVGTSVVSTYHQPCIQSPSAVKLSFRSGLQSRVKIGPGNGIKRASYLFSSPSTGHHRRQAGQAAQGRVRPTRGQALRHLRGRPQYAAAGPLRRAAAHRAAAAGHGPRRVVRQA